MSVEGSRIASLAPFACVILLVGCAQSASPEQAESLASSIKPMVERGQVQFKTVTLPDGRQLKQARLSSGFEHVLIERKNSDGTRDVACVDTVKQAEQFLVKAPQGAAQ